MKQNGLLYEDIENYYAHLSSWDLWAQGNHNREIKEKSIICISYMWEGDSAATTISVRDFPKLFKKDRFNDYEVLRAYKDIRDTASLTVAHNGDSFDTKEINGRLLKHRLGPLAPIKSIDTLKVAKKYFRLMSNRLDYIAHYLGIGRKIKMDLDDWHGCEIGDIESFKKMEKYNRYDVKGLLKPVCIELLPYMQQLQTYNKMMSLINSKGHSALTCQKIGCNSIDGQFRGWYTATQRRWRCNKCGGWSIFTKALCDKLGVV